jgi:cytochrome c553
MTHKVVTAVISAIFVLFVGVALAFAWSVEARAPEGPADTAGTPAIPHRVERATAECARCHEVRGGGMPLTHRAFAVSSCRSCHEQLDVPPVPHSTEMGDGRCALCHGDPDQELGIPRPHLAFDEARCTSCHEALRESEHLRPPSAGESAKRAPRVPHPMTGAFTTCLDCHEIGERPGLPVSHQLFPDDSCSFICHFRASNGSAAL